MPSPNPLTASRAWLRAGGWPRRLALAAAVVIAVALVAYYGQDDRAFVRHRLFAMATWIDLTLPSATTRHHPELLAEIEAELRSFERDFYPWTDGELARLNAALSAGEAFEASPALAEVLVAAQRAAVASDGAFDPGVGSLVELYGLHDAAAPPPPLPDDATVAALLASSGSIRDLDIVRGRVTAPSLRLTTGDRRTVVRAKRYTLDLGAIAKGAAVDRIALRLIALDVAPALVNAGGNLRVIGERPDRPWRIGIQAPRDDGLLGSVELRAGESTSSSGDYERYRELDSDAGGGDAGGNTPRLHHILDPRTGRPVAHTRAVTVIAADAETADAASTALFVAGPGDWLAVASRLGITAALRVDAEGRIEMTRAMRDRFQPGASETSAIITVVD
jgi:thiamine biosynthesis lipoprotein